MAEAHPVVVSHQPRHQYGARVALSQDPVGSALPDHAVQGAEQRRRQLGQGLVGLHQVQIEVWLDPEEVQNLVEHLAVLAGGADQRTNPVRVPGQFFDDRRHFDGFGPSTDNAQHGQHQTRSQCYKSVCVGRRRPVGRAPSAAGLPS